MDNKIHKFYKKNKYYIPLKNEKYLDFHYGNWRKKPKFQLIQQPTSLIEFM